MLTRIHRILFSPPERCGWERAKASILPRQANLLDRASSSLRDVDDLEFDD